MDLLNADGTDFSNEVVLLIALMLEMINAAHLIAYWLDRILGNANLKSKSDTGSQARPERGSESRKKGGHSVQCRVRRCIRQGS